jgi:hypothetical protein
MTRQGWSIALAMTLVMTMAACAAESPPPSQAPSETQLSATLTKPTEIVLRWTGGDPGLAGRVVEFATEPAGPYTILGFLPPAQTTYTHPELIPNTTFYYRVRPYSGPASKEVEVNLPEGALDENADHSWANPRTLPGGPGQTQPMGAPTDLTATVVHANGVKFTWTDHAGAEDGYLLEIKPLGANDFRVIALLDPDINSFGIITEPQEKHAVFRVRAFQYGTASNLAQRMTGSS